MMDWIDPNLVVDQITSLCISIIFITNLCSSGHSNINWRAEARRTETSRSTEVGGDISENRFDKFATMFIFYYNKFWLSVKILEISRPSCPLPNYYTVTCVVTAGDPTNLAGVSGDVQRTLHWAYGTTSKEKVLDLHYSDIESYKAERSRKSQVRN